MPNRRRPDGLKIMSPLAVAPAVTDARTGGLGLDFEQVPGVLAGAGAAEWRRLGLVYERHPTRFREGDRAALSAYCAFFAAFEQAAAEVARDGPVVPGRSARDRGRLVKNPATVAMREASVQLRFWARELGLTPDARGKSGIREGEPDPRDDPESNPFLAPKTVRS